MFDTLTDEERQALRSKLYTWGHAFAEVGAALAGAARACTSYDHGLYEHATRYYDAMDDLYALRDGLAA